jgi:hypothetical protein
MPEAQIPGYKERLTDYRPGQDARIAIPGGKRNNSDGTVR